uniref:Elongator acetyltransferase complex subunit 5 n=1 Tax=Ovis aries TaxID=9940 RepID=A0AC11DXZ7_SHEEP
LRPSEGLARPPPPPTDNCPNGPFRPGHDSVEWEGRSLLKALVKKSALRGEQVHVLGCEVSEEEFREGFDSNINSRRCGRSCGSNPSVRKIPWRRKWQPTLVFLPGDPVDRGAWWATVHGVNKGVGHHLVTKQQHGSHTCSWEMQELPEVSQRAVSDNSEKSYRA